MKQYIESIVRQSIIDYYHSKSTKDSNKKYMLVLLESYSPTPAKIWETIQALSTKYKITLCVSEHWINIPDNIRYDELIQLDRKNMAQLKSITERADLLFIPNSTYALIAKLAMIIDENLALWVTIQMLLNGKSILISTDSIKLKGMQKLTTPYSVNENIQRYIRQLQNYHVHLIPLSKVNEWLNSFNKNQFNKKHIVLAKHVQEIANEGEEELLVPKNSLITPMCKDMARELGVTLKIKE